MVGRGKKDESVGVGDRSVWRTPQLEGHGGAWGRCPVNCSRRCDYRYVDAEWWRESTVSR